MIENLRKRYEQLQGLLNTPANQGGGLLGNISQGALLGSAIYGQGVQGKDPFAALLPAVTQTAQLSKYMTPKEKDRKMVKGAHGFNDYADTSYSTTTSFVVIHSSAKIRFIAPPSGNVEIFASVFCKWSSNRWLQFGLSDNATYNTLDVTHEHFIGEGDETDEMQLNHQWVITGLTAGTSYTYWLGAKAEQASRVTLYWGGDATGEYAPFIMKATALPSAIEGV